nr:probable serine/threonine-protein kinase DDB_G0282963 [Dermatophagoides farinae]
MIKTWITMARFIMIIQFLILFIVALSRITIIETTSSSSSSSSLSTNVTDSSLPAAHTTDVNNQTDVTATVSSPAIISTALESKTNITSPPTVVYQQHHHPSLSISEANDYKNNSLVLSSMVFYDEQPIDPNSSAIKILTNKPKIIYSDRSNNNNNNNGDDDEYHLERDIDQYFKNKEKRIRFRQNQHDDSNDDDDDDEDLINLIDNRKQVVNIIEVKRPPTNVPPPETIIYKGRRFRLFRPPKYMLQRAKKRILPAESIVEDDPHHHRNHYHHEIPRHRSNRNKARVGRKAYAGKLSEFPVLPPLNRGQPMVAKVYWRRTIYPMSSTMNRPKRRTIYETVTTNDDDDDDDDDNLDENSRQKRQNKKIEKYIVLYVRKNPRDKNNNTQNKNSKTIDEPFMATSSDNMPQKISIKNKKTKSSPQTSFHELYNDDDIDDEEPDSSPWSLDSDDDVDDDEDFDDEQTAKNRNDNEGGGGDDDDDVDDNNTSNNDDENNYKKLEKFQRPIPKWPVWNKMGIPSLAPLPMPPESSSSSSSYTNDPVTKPIINFYHHQYTSDSPELVSKNNNNDSERHRENIVHRIPTTSSNKNFIGNNNYNPHHHHHHPHPI